MNNKDKEIFEFKTFIVFDVTELIIYYFFKLLARQQRAKNVHPVQNENISRKKVHSNIMKNFTFFILIGLTDNNSL